MFGCPSRATSGRGCSDSGRAAGGGRARRGTTTSHPRKAVLARVSREWGSETAAGVGVEVTERVSEEKSRANGTMLSRSEAEARRRGLHGRRSELVVPERFCSWECSPATRRKATEDETQQLLSRLVSLRSVQPTPWKKALALVESARGRGRRITTAVYNELLHVLARAGQLRRLVDTFEAMADEGVRRSEKTYNIIIHAYGRRGMTCAALRAFNKMAAEGLEPSEVTYATAFFACRSRGWALEAMRLYRSMKESGIPPSARSVVPLLSVCRTAKTPQHAIAVIQDFREMDIQMTPRMLSQQAMTYQHFGLHEDLEELIESTLLCPAHEHDELFDAAACSAFLTAARSLDRSILRRALDRVLGLNAVHLDSVLQYTLIYSFGLLKEAARAQAFIRGVQETRFDPSLAINSRNTLLHALRGDLTSLRSIFNGPPDTVVGYNVLLDTVWDHVSQGEAVRVIGQAITSGVFKNTMSRNCAGQNANDEEDREELMLNLVGLSSGAARAAIIYWMNTLSDHRHLICDAVIVVGWGKDAHHMLKDECRDVRFLLASSGSPFVATADNPAVFAASKDDVSRWLAKDKAERWGIEWLLY